MVSDKGAAIAALLLLRTENHVSDDDDNGHEEIIMKSIDYEYYGAFYDFMFEGIEFYNFVDGCNLLITDPENRNTITDEEDACYFSGRSNLSRYFEGVIPENT